MEFWGSGRHVRFLVNQVSKMAVILGARAMSPATTPRMGAYGYELAIDDTIEDNRVKRFTRLANNLIILAGERSFCVGFRNFITFHDYLGIEHSLDKDNKLLNRSNTLLKRITIMYLGALSRFLKIQKS